MGGLANHWDESDQDSPLRPCISKCYVKKKYIEETHPQRLHDPSVVGNYEVHQTMYLLSTNQGYKATYIYIELGLQYISRENL